MLDTGASPAALTVGRIVSSPMSPVGSPNATTLTYTVYNETPSVIDALVLSTSFRTGVAVESVSTPPVHTDSEWRWSLGRLDPYAQVSVEVTVTLGTPDSLDLDTGARVAGILGSANVSDLAPAARLRPATAPIEPLNSTVDANAADREVQHRAAVLDYDPERIVTYLHDAIGYESYVGSLRGARGTLGSQAGNALDEASLGVALLRASGIPARYAQGTLSDSQAQQLILSMFPEPTRIVGLIDSGTERADPANDPQLLAEARDHFWIEYDDGNGFRAVDTTFPSGQPVTIATATFNEVPDALRHKAVVRLLVESAGTLTSLVGGPQRRAVLDVPFSVPELVGHPLSLLHLVHANQVSGLFFGTETVTYSPLLMINQDDDDPSDDPVYTGIDYQEFFTNFPLGSQFITGLFLQVELQSPETQGIRRTETLEQIVFDRIGYQSRRHGGAPASPLNEAGSPILSPLDVTTLTIAPAIIPATSVMNRFDSLRAFRSDLPHLDNVSTDAEEDGLSPQDQDALNVVKGGNARLTAYLGEATLATADRHSGEFSRYLLVQGYADSPRVVASTRRLDVDPASGAVSLVTEIDLLRTVGRSLASPLQSMAAEAVSQYFRGIAASFSESETLATTRPETWRETDSSYGTVLTAAQAGIPLLRLTRSSQAELARLDISSEARSRITEALQAGRDVVVPVRPVDVGGGPTIAWLELDPATSHAISVAEDGSHGTLERSLIGKLNDAIKTARAQRYGQALRKLIEQEIRAIRNELDDALLDPNRLLTYSRDLLRTQGTQGAERLAQRSFDQVINGSIRTLEKELEQYVLRTIENLAPRANIEIALQALRAKLGTVDPPVGSLLMSPGASAAFDALGAGSPGTVSLGMYHEGLFSVLVDSAEVPTVFRLGVRNGSTDDAVFRFEGVSIPAGMTLETSLTQLLVPAGQTGEVGLVLRPGSNVPAAGSSLDMIIRAVVDGRPDLTAEISQPFLMPELHAVSLTPDRARPSTLPGEPVTLQLTLRAEGNTAETVHLSAFLPDQLTASGLASVSLAPGESRSVSITLTPESTAALNSTLFARIAATFGAPGSERVINLEIPVLVALPGTRELADAAEEVGSHGKLTLSNRLRDLASSLTGLAQEASSTQLKGQALANLDALIRELGADPFLGQLGAELANERASLVAAGTPSAVQDAAVALGNHLASLAAAVVEAQRHQFDLTMTPGSAVALSGNPSRFEFELENTGTTATTYLFSLNSLPAGVQASFTTQRVTLQPGERLEIGPNGVRLTLVQPDGQADPFGFTVRVEAETSPAIARSVSGTVTARDAFVRVVAVDATPGYVEPGVPVRVSARVLNVVNREQAVTASYTLTTASGQIQFTSVPVNVTLGVVPSLITLDLGSIDTTGLPRGDYLLTVTLADASGQPIPGGTGIGRVQIGAPVSASITTTPSTLATGDGTVTTTLQVRATSNSTGEPLLSLVGLVDTNATATSLVLRGDLAYVAGSDDVSIVDISNPLAPHVLTTFAGERVFKGGGNTVVIVGNRLIVSSTPTANASKFSLFTYDLTHPTQPVFLGSTEINYVFPVGMFLQGNTLLIPTSILFTLGSSITNVGGDLLAIDLTDPVHPQLSDVLFNNRGPTRGGDFLHSSLEFGDATTAYLASSSVTGNATQNGVGRLRVVDIANPAQLTQVSTLDIPGTVGLIDLFRSGNRMLVAGSTGGYRNPFQSIDNFGLTGTLSLTVLDVSDPRNPSPVGVSLATPNTFPNRGQGGTTNPVGIIDLGNELFAISGTLRDEKPGLLIVDLSSPSGWATQWIPTSALQGGLRVAGNYLYTASADGLAVYDIGSIVGSTATVSVDVPRGTGAEVIVGSFSLAPDQIVPGVDHDTLTWHHLIGAGRPNLVITWDTRVTGLTSGESRPVTLGGSVVFVSDGVAGSVGLAPTAVAADPILGLTPASRTVRPGQSAEFTLRVANPTSSVVTYTLAVQGVAAESVELPRSVSVPPRGTLDVPLTLTTRPYAAAGGQGFAVLASSSDGARGSVEGRVLVAGEPVPIDNEARGVVVELVPSRASAGRGTPASFAVRVTNTGSIVDTFTLAVDLPSGIGYTFAHTSVLVMPGIDQFVDVPLILTPSAAIAPGELGFRVTAVSTAIPSAQDSAFGTLEVLGQGVSVRLGPDPVNAGGSITLTVTNQGQSTDTFDLALAGPGALVAQLGVDRVTLAPGFSQHVPLTSTIPGFALPGDLDLTGIATSRADSRVAARDRTSLRVATTRGLSATFEPGVRILAAPGPTTFVLRVQNTGNIWDSYSATIKQTDGPVTASLDDIDSRSVQSIPTFMLSGLGAGAILVRAELATLGRGTITVEIRSSDGALAATATAVVTTAVSTSTRLELSASRIAAGSTGFATAIVSVPPGVAPASGTVTFVVNGQARPAVALSLVDGEARATIALDGLAPGVHSIQAVYSGGAAYEPSTSGTSSLVVDAAGPRVVSVERYGVHWQVTVLVVRFDTPLDPSRAGARQTYRLVGPGGRVIPLTSAAYDPNTLSVRLAPAHRLNLHARYVLTVRGHGSSALVSSTGAALVGSNNQPGSDSHQIVTSANLVRTPPRLNPAQRMVRSPLALTRWLSIDRRSLR